MVVAGIAGLVVYVAVLAAAAGAGAGGRRRHGCGDASAHPPPRLAAMFKLFKKWWKYLTAKLTGSFEERADPKVQLEQAISEAQNQHRRLREQAANVIANQKQGELRLNQKMGELEKLNGNARQALIMAADAEKAGDAVKASAVHVGRRDDRQPADPGREGRREPEDDGHRGDPGLRPGQGRRRPEQPPAAGEDRREVQAAVPARPGEDAGGDELGDGPAQRERGRRRAVAGRGRSRRSRPATPRPWPRPSCPRRPSSRACSRSSRPPPTSRPRAASASCAPSSASAARHRPPRHNRSSRAAGRERAAAS